jgi:hypothetical protein
MSEYVYGDAPAVPVLPPLVKPSPEASRKSLKDKLARIADCQKSIASLQTAFQRADELLQKTEDALISAEDLLATVKAAHGAGMAEHLAKGSSPSLTSPEINAARAKVQEAEDQRDAANSAYLRIEQQLKAARANLESCGGTHYEMRDLVADEVHKLYEQTQRKLLDLARYRAALVYCLRSGLCGDPTAVNHLLDVVKFQVQDSSAVQGIEWTKAIDIRDWIAEIEKLKTDPDAKFPPLKLVGIK